jgi:hypothetical protein
MLVFQRNNPRSQLRNLGAELAVLIPQFRLLLAPRRFSRKPRARAAQLVGWVVAFFAFHRAHSFSNRSI